MSETQDVLNSSMASALPVLDDDELLAELEACEAAGQKRHRPSSNSPRPSRCRAPAYTFKRTKIESPSTRWAYRQAGTTARYFP
jgi:predicted Zn-ribbon and HTH transcriptional regulator